MWTPTIALKSDGATYRWIPDTSLIGEEHRIRSVEALVGGCGVRSKGGSVAEGKRSRAVSIAVAAATMVSSILATLPLADAAVSGPPAVLIPTSGAYFGSWVAPRAGESRADAIVRVESQIGRRFAIDHQYYKWDSNFPGAHEAWTVGQGRIPFLNWKAQRQNGQAITWSRIASGAEDAAIIARADAIEAFGVPVYLSLHHEPEDDLATWGTPAEYAAAFRHVVDVFRAQGVDNVAFVWTMMAWTFDPRSGKPIEDYYPGDAHVDLIGSDGYNFYPTKPGSTWNSFQTVFQPTQDFAVRHAKPWMAVEWGAQEDPAVPGRKGQWIIDALATAKTWPELKGLIYFDEIKDGRPWITDSSSSSMAGYAQMGADAYLHPEGATSPQDAGPTIALTSPQADSTVMGVVALEADALDSEGVAQVEFFAGGASVGVDPDGRDGWRLDWDSSTVPDGVANVWAEVTDSVGQTSSTGVGVLVDNLGPSISLTAPTEGAVVSGIVNLTATAIDDVGLEGVEFTVDGTSIGIDSDPHDGWSIPWDTTTHAAGTVLVEATVTDTAGRESQASVGLMVADPMTPPAVMMVVGSPGSLLMGEISIRDRLTSDGFAVNFFDDDTVEASDTNGAAFVLVTSTVDSNVLGSTLRYVQQPVWVSKPWLLDDMKMTGRTANVDYGTNSSESVVIARDSHPLAAGLSGSVLVTPSNKVKSFGAPRPSAIVIATSVGAPTTFVYQPGAEMVGGEGAAGCRLAMSVFRNAPVSFTPDAWAMFDAATRYAASGCGA